jgi:hypothetical protein
MNQQRQHTTILILVLSILLTMTPSSKADSLKCMALAKDLNPLSGSAMADVQDFEVMTGELNRNLSDQLQLKRINSKKDIQWRGPSTPKFALSRSFPFEERLSAKNLKRSHEEYDRSALAEILGVFGQISMEQGQRYTIHSQQWRTIDLELKSMSEILKSGDLTQVSSKISLIEQSLASLAEGQGVFIREGTQVAGVDNRTKTEWPLDGTPLTTSQIIEPIVHAINQAYKATGSGDANQVLTRTLTEAYPKFLLQGRKLFHAGPAIDTFTFRIDLFKALIDAAIKDPTKDRSFLNKTYLGLVEDFKEVTE